MQQPLNTKDHQKQFAVAAVGASAGGLDAFKSLIKAIPEETGIAWILVQHQHPKYESRLTEILQRLTSIPVVEIVNDAQIKPNIIYVLPSNSLLTVKNEKLRVTRRPEKDNLESNYPINSFFNSVATAFEGNAIGIVLSGTGSDGTKGLKAIKDHGGITIAQTPETCIYPSMPQSAIDAQMINFILPASEIPARLLEITHLITHSKEVQRSAGEDEKFFKEILSLLNEHEGMDFTYYKQTTIRRRILRRMVLNKNDRIEDYVLTLRKDKSERSSLYQDMLIPVTSFFRDEKVFDNLCNSVFPKLPENKKSEAHIRIWVAGCSTGEEAYSIAICFKEYLGVRNEQIQIFATDLSEVAIAKARAGQYTKAEASAVSHGRLDKFFTMSQGKYLINKNLRDMCVFAVHNFLKDPPFSKVDFISCRNVLIYMDTYLQKKALTVFHYALNPLGLLMLGKSENTIGITDLFATGSKTEKIFIRKTVPVSLPRLTSKDTAIAANTNTFKRTKMPDTILIDSLKKADDLILEKYTPAAVVINEAMDIVQFRGNTSLFLEQAAGKPTHNLLKLARPGLAFELRNIVHKMVKDKLPAKKENIPVEINHEQYLVGIEAVPLDNVLEPHCLIIFREELKSKVLGSFSAEGKLSQNEEDMLRLLQSEKELAQLREDMRSITEEQEASNEELQSTNEELLSSNEELQSLNEELETSKEELQSTVEELTVVNQEMANLNDQLAVEKDYAEAILGTIPQPMLVLDAELRVSIANELFYQKFLVTPEQTEGRLIYEIGNGQWDIMKLRELLESILPDQKSFFGFEVEHEFERIGKLIMRLNAREVLREKGEARILLVIEDVTDYVRAVRELKESEALLKEQERLYEVATQSTPDLIYVFDLNYRFTYANEALLQMWGRTKEDSIGKDMLEVGYEPWHAEMHIKEIDEVIASKKAIRGQVAFPHATLGSRTYDYIFSPVINDQGEVEAISGTTRDISDIKNAEDRLRESEEQFSTLSENMENLAWIADSEGSIYWYNKRWYDYTGTNLEDMRGWGWEKVHHPDHVHRVVEFVKRAWFTGEPFELTFPLRAANGSYRWFLTRAFPIVDGNGKLSRWIGTNTDITDITKAQEKIEQSEKVLRQINHELDLATSAAEVGIWSLDIASGLLDWSALHKKMWGYDGNGGDLLYEAWHSLILPEDRDLAFERMNLALSNKTIYEVDYRIVRADDGATRWIHSTGKYIYDDADVATSLTGVSMDITDQKNAENKIRESEHYFRYLTDTVPAIIWITEPDGYCSYLNKTWYAYTGQSEEEGEGYGWLTATHPEDAEEAGKIFLKANTDQIPFEILYRLKTKDGSYRWAKDSGSPRFSADGKYEGMIGTVVDVHEETIVTRQIKESEERYSQLIVSSPSAIAVLKGSEFEIATANDAIKEIWGKGKEVIGKKYFELLPELVEQGYPAIFKDVYDTGVPFNAMESPVNFHQSGILKLRYYNFIIYAQRNPMGQIDGIGIIATEVTSQAEMNNKIRESEKQFRLLADSMPQHIWTADAAGNLNYFNESVFNYSGLSNEQILKDGWLQIVHPEDRNENIKQWTEAISEGVDFLIEHRFKRHDGVFRWQLSRAVPQKDANGNINKWVGTSTDIQELKEEEQRKGDFIKMVSHELKTPVTSIKGYVQLLLSLLKPGEDLQIAGLPLRPSLERVDKQILRLTRIITELLDLSRLDEEKLSLNKERFSLKELVEDTIQDVSLTSNTHKIHFLADADGEIHADKDRIQQVLINFITNAIKYSPMSSRVDVYMGTANDHHLAVSVRDFGIGINKADHEKIFERFFRVSGKNEETYSGFGIGLFIANQIVKRHEGKIVVESKPGEGSVFTFTLPLAAK